MELESLIVPMSLDKSDFIDGLAGAKDAAADFFGGIAQAAAGLAVAGITAFIGASVAAVNTTMEWADAMDGLGDVTGMTNEQLAAWTYASQKAGVPVDKLTKGMSLLEKTLGGTGESLSKATDKLKLWGVNVLDSSGMLLDNSDILDNVSVAYNALGSQTERTAMLMDIFGKSGADLIDVFDTMAASGGISSVTDQVNAMGLVVDPAIFERFGRSIADVQLTATGLANIFTSGLTPSLMGVVDNFNAWLGQEWIKSGIKDIGDGVGWLLDWVQRFAATPTPEVFDELVQKASGLWMRFERELNVFLKDANDWVNSGNITSVLDLIIDKMFPSGTERVNPSVGSGGNTMGLAATLVQSIFHSIEIADWGQVTTGIGLQLQNAIDRIDWGGLETQLNDKIQALANVILRLDDAVPTWAKWASWIVIALLAVVVLGQVIAGAQAAAIAFEVFLGSVGALGGGLTGLWGMLINVSSAAEGLTLLVGWLGDELWALGAVVSSAGFAFVAFGVAVAAMVAYAMWKVGLLQSTWDAFVYGTEQNFAALMDFIGGNWDSGLEHLKNSAMNAMEAIKNIFLFGWDDVFQGLFDLFGMTPDIQIGNQTISAHANGGLTGRGFSLVGEYGPEIIQAPFNSRVYTASDSAKMMGGGNGLTINIAYTDKSMLSLADEEEMASRLARVITNQLGTSLDTALQQRGIRNGF